MLNNNNKVRIVIKKYGETITQLVCFCIPLEINKLLTNNKNLRDNFNNDELYDLISQFKMINNQSFIENMLIHSDITNDILYENYIYISGEESAGIHIFDTQKNTLVNFDPAFGTDWRNYKSYINICENYLINVNYYLGREKNPTVIEIVNLEKNKSIEEIDYRIEFKDPYRIKNVNIRQNIAYFYCLNLQNQNILWPQAVVLQHCNLIFQF